MGFSPQVELASPTDERLLCRLLRAAERFRQSPQQIRRNHRMLAYTFEHHVARKTVEMHRGTNR